MKMYGYDVTEAINNLEICLYKWDTLKIIKEYFSYFYDSEMENYNTEEFLEHISKYEGEGAGSGYTGIPALLADWISMTAFYEVEVFHENEHWYIGLPFSTPWGFTNLEKQLTESEFSRDLLLRLRKVLDLDFSIKPATYCVTDVV